VWRFVKVSGFAKREIPLDVDAILDLASDYAPENEWQALMEAPPGTEPETPKNHPNPAVDVVRDCVEMLLDEDQYVVHAIHYERITYEELGTRLGCSAPHAWRLVQIAQKRLGELLLLDGRIKDLLDADE